MNDEEFEKRLNKEKSFLTSKNHTAELEKQLKEQREKHKVRDETEEIKEDKKKLFSEQDDILTSSDSGIGGALPGIIISIVTIGIVLSVGLIVLKELKGAVSTEEYNQFNVSGDLIQTISTAVPTWIGIMIIVTLAFIVMSFIGRRY